VLQVKLRHELWGKALWDTYFSFCRAIVFAILADIAILGSLY